MKNSTGSMWIRGEKQGAISEVTKKTKAGRSSPSGFRRARGYFKATKTCSLAGEEWSASRSELASFSIFVGEMVRFRAS
jgi:hypothetical protein